MRLPRVFNFCSLLVYLSKWFKGYIQSYSQNDNIHSNSHLKKKSLENYSSLSEQTKLIGAKCF